MAYCNWRQWEHKNKWAIERKAEIKNWNDVKVRKGEQKDRAKHGEEEEREQIRGNKEWNVLGRWDVDGWSTADMRPVCSLMIFKESLPHFLLPWMGVSMPKIIWQCSSVSLCCRIIVECLASTSVRTRWFKYDRDWFVCKQAALRSSCATLREWSHNLHPPSCSG